MKAPSPSLFDVAADAIGYAQAFEGTEQPRSQVRLELKHPTPAPMPADGLFKAGHTTWGHNAQGRFVVKHEG